jgi:hypothetical protein
MGIAFANKPGLLNQQWLQSVGKTQIAIIIAAPNPNMFLFTTSVVFVRMKKISGGAYGDNN